MASSPEGVTEKRPELREDFPSDLALDLDVDSGYVFLGRFTYASADQTLFSVMRNGGFKLQTRDLMHKTGEDALAVFVSPDEIEDVNLIRETMQTSPRFQVLNDAYSGKIPLMDLVADNFTPKEAVRLIYFALKNEHKKAKEQRRKWDSMGLDTELADKDMRRLVAIMRGVEMSAMATGAILSGELISGWNPQFLVKDEYHKALSQFGNRFWRKR